MAIYQLDYILHEPAESEGWMYLAEVPALQGCMGSIVDVDLVGQADPPDTESKTKDIQCRPDD